MVAIVEGGLFATAIAVVGKLATVAMEAVQGRFFPEDGYETLKRDTATDNEWDDQDNKVTQHLDNDEEEEEEENKALEDEEDIQNDVGKNALGTKTYNAPVDFVSRMAKQVANESQVGKANQRQDVVSDVTYGNN